MYDVTAQGDNCRGTGDKGQQWRPSHGLERPGLGTLSHTLRAHLDQVLHTVVLPGLPR